MISLTQTEKLVLFLLNEGFTDEAFIARVLHLPPEQVRLAVDHLIALKLVKVREGENED
jgi:hypothetical protein